MNKIIKKNIEELQAASLRMLERKDVLSRSEAELLGMTQNLGQIMVEIIQKIEQDKAADDLRAAIEKLPVQITGPIVKNMTTIFSWMANASGTNAFAMANHWRQTTALVAGFLEGDHHAEDD